MIKIRDLYNVLSAVVPLYVAMMLAYSSVRWWKIFTPDQCSGINRFVALFAVPLLSFHYISSNNPFNMNFRFLAADSLAKLVILTVLVLWVRFGRRASLDWMITLFSLATLPNTLVMGIPLLKAMYGSFSGDLMVQIVVFQCIIWYTLLLFLFEYRAARNLIADAFPDTAPSIVSFKVESDVVSLDGHQPLQTQAEIRGDGKIHVTVRKSTSSVVSSSHRYHHGGGGLLSLPSSKALTPRPSNMTGVEIYSLPTSRNPTPRGSSFNHADFYSMLAGRACCNNSPRHSNFDAAFFGGPTPRPSNFEDDGGSPARFPCPFIYHSTAARSFHERATPGVNEDSHALMPAIPIGYSSCGFGLAGDSPASPQPPALPPACKGQAATVKPADGKKEELRMFVWSSSASPASEKVLRFFGQGPRELNPALQGNMPPPKDVRMFVMPATDPGVPSAGLHAEARPEHHDEYGREEFSFGNHAMSLEEAMHSNQSLPKFALNSSVMQNANGKVHLEHHHHHHHHLLHHHYPHNHRHAGKPVSMPPATVMTKLILVMVWRKLVRNPNTYSSLLGVIWSLISARWGIVMPVIMSKSISILSDAGLGMAMFSLGLFMALQPRIIACGNTVAAFGMAVRFLTGPAVMAAASITIGIRGILLHVAIVQAALPQGIVPFVFAKEYNVHPDILSTGVIFGMLIALPITIFYYFLLGL